MKKTQYYITIKLTDQSLQVDPDQINTLSYTTQNILHSDSEYSKTCTLENGDVLAISSVVGTQQSKIAKLNKEGKPIFSNVTLSRGYSPDAQLIQPKNSDFYLHYMLNTGVRAKTNDATYTSGIDSVYSSKIYIVDKASHRPLYVFYDKFSVSGLFDVIKKNQSR